MKFQITEIEFDFANDDVVIFTPEGERQLLPCEKEEITADTIGEIWEADDEDDLVEEITCATGWCIKSLNYRHVLNTH